MSALSLKALSTLFYNPHLTSFPRTSSFNCQLLASPGGKSRILPRTLPLRAHGLVKEMRYGHDSFCHKGENGKSMKKRTDKGQGCSEKREDTSYEDIR